MGPSGCDAPSNDCGNPINTATGNKYSIESDFEIPQLELKRYYNSDPEARSGGFGTNWTHTYERRVVTSTDGNGQAVATVERPDGKSLVFRQSVAGWVADAGIDAELASGPVSTPGWTFREFAVAEVEHFDDRGRLVRIVRPELDDILLEYNDGLTENDLGDFSATAIALENGRRISIRYDVQNRIEAIIDPSGSEYRYLRDANDRLTAVEFGASTIRQYRYAEPGLADGMSNALLLTGIIDAAGDRFATYAYDSLGRATLSMHGDGAQRVEVEYVDDATSRVTLTSGAVQSRGLVVLNGVKRASSVQESCDGCVPSDLAYEFDGAGRLSAQVDRLGTRTGHQTDAMGRRTSRADDVDAQGDAYRVTSTQWHAFWPEITQRTLVDDTGAAIRRETRSISAEGWLQSSTVTDLLSGSARTTSYGRCLKAGVDAGTCPMVGKLLEVDGPRTDVVDRVTYAYRQADAPGCVDTPANCPYRKGDAWKTTDAQGLVTEVLAYDGAGRVVSSSDPNGTVTDFEYHPRGWLAARKVRGTDPSSEADDRITRIDYWPTGLVREVIQPDGSAVSYAYDGAHRLTDVFDADGNRIHYTLDDAGNRTAEETKDDTGVLMRKLSRVYDTLGRLEQQKDAFGHATTFTYDANNQIDATTDALGRVTGQDYDPIGRLRTTLQDVGGIEAATGFDYDALDHLTKVTDPKGLDTDYGYNAFGDLLTLSSPDTGATGYTYDSAGNRKTQTDARGITATYAYDAMNRLTGIAYSDGSAGTSFVYDDTTFRSCSGGQMGGGAEFARGRLSRMVDASGTTQYCYNRFGDLTARKQTINGQEFITRFTHTASGQAATMTYPGGSIIDYVRNGQGQVVEIGYRRLGVARQVLLTGATYYPFGPIAQWTYGNGRAMARSLDLNYRPGFVEDGDAGGLKLGYQFDAVGNLVKLRPADQTDPPLREYRYDDLDRLTDTLEGTTLAPLQSYGYDATGNRTSASTGGAATAYTYPANSHRLSQVGLVARTYDAVGNTLSIGGTARQFTYNAANRMSQAKQAGVVKMNYLYNGKGEQVRRHLGSANTYTVFDEAGRWIGDWTAANAPVQQVIWLDDLPVGLLVGNYANQKLYYVEPDALGTPRVVIDPVRNPVTKGTAVWKWELAGEAFGNSAPDQDPDGDAAAFVFDMRFPGQRHDAASGLSQNYFREYEPAVGRFSQSDPVGLQGGLALYAYSGGMPLVAWDAFGLTPSLVSGPPRGKNVMGWVSCTRGSLDTVVNEDVLNRFYGKCTQPVRDCVRAHEQAHINYARAKDPRICRQKFWEPSYWTIQRLQESNKTATELWAYAAELECLKKKLEDYRCDAACTETIRRAIRDASSSVRGLINE